MRIATVQADLVETLFTENQTATSPRGITEEDPWGGRDRVSILLLGGDGSVTREGIRTDSVMLLVLNTRTGRSVMFSLPRNMMYAEFPEDSPLKAVFPEGFTPAATRPAACSTRSTACCRRGTPASSATPTTRAPTR